MTPYTSKGIKRMCSKTFQKICMIKKRMCKGLAFDPFFLRFFQKKAKSEIQNEISVCILIAGSWEDKIIVPILFKKYFLYIFTYNS